LGLAASIAPEFALPSLPHSKPGLGRRWKTVPYPGQCNRLQDGRATTDSPLFRPRSALV
jgi:hypothetical protein